MKFRLSILMIAAALVSGTPAFAVGSQPPAPPANAAGASATTVTLKPVLKTGLELRYRVKIDRTDSNIVPKAMMQMAPAVKSDPPKATTPEVEVPKSDAPHSDPQLTDPAPKMDPSPKLMDVPQGGMLSAVDGAVHEEGQPEMSAARSQPPDASEPPGKAQEPVKKDDGAETVQATSRVVVETVQVIRVKDAGDGGASMELVIESIKADVKMPEWTEAYDSTKPEDDKDRDNRALQAFKPLVGLIMTLTTDKDGNIATVTGNETFQGTGSMAGYIQQLTGTDNIRIYWNMALHAKKGGGTLNVGDTWTNEEAINAKQMGAKFEMLTTNTLRAVTGGVASVDSTGSMRLVPFDAARKPPFDLTDAKLLATSTWDATDGFAKTLEFERSFRLDGSAQGFPLSRQSVIKTMFERVK